MVPCDLTQPSLLTQAHLTRGTLAQSRLTQARLTQTRLTQASLTQTRLTHPVGLTQARLPCRRALRLTQEPSRAAAGR